MLNESTVIHKVGVPDQFYTYYSTEGGITVNVVSQYAVFSICLP